MKSPEKLHILENKYWTYEKDEHILMKGLPWREEEYLRTAGPWRMATRCEEVSSS